jgi:hypothetical protein
MITFNPQTAPRHTSASWQEDFLQLLPKIERQATIAFRGLRPEEREEAVAEVVAAALIMYRRLVELDRTELAFASPLALYGIRRYRVGRRVAATGTRDVHSRQVQAKKGFSVQYLGTPYEQRKQWREALIENRHTPILDQVQFRVDFPAWLDTCSRRDRLIAEELAGGERTGKVAKMVGVSSSRISQLRSELRQAWETFLGEDAETDVAAAPA